MLVTVVHAQLTFTTNNDSITITGYIGSPGDVVIPAATNGYPVTSIQPYVFNYSSLTSITIPSSVTNIGYYFYCPNLKGIYFQGDAIADPGPFFSGRNTPYFYPATIYYSPGTMGWGSTWGGVPTAQWVPCGLQAAITPAAAASDGAQWQMDGGDWQTNGARLMHLPAGNHTVHFNRIIGWQSPADQTISVGTNVVAYATGTYAVIPQPPTFRVLHTFTGLDGANPTSYLIVSNNTMYGMTSSGGSSNCGTIFAMNTDGAGFTNLYSFTGGSDGASPEAGLVLSGNTLYGNTPSSVFKINTDGSDFTVLHTFSGAWFIQLFSGLILSSNTLYGTTEYGGGTVYSIKTDGTCFTNLHTFNIVSGEMWWPYGSLELSGNTIYGVTFEGDPAGPFAVQTDGTGFTTSGVVLPADFGNAQYYNRGYDAIPWGTTAFGVNCWQTGTLTYPDPNPGNYQGIIYAANGTNSTVLHYFVNLNEGISPHGALAISGTTLYGMAEFGGNYSNATFGNGTIYSLSFPPQQLTMTLSGTNVILMWPSGAFGAEYNEFSLQSTTNFVAPVWTSVPTAPVIINGWNVVSNPILGAQQYYRLSQ